MLFFRKGSSIGPTKISNSANKQKIKYFKKGKNKIDLIGLERIEGEWDGLVAILDAGLAWSLLRFPLGLACIFGAPPSW